MSLSHRITSILLRQLRKEKEEQLAKDAEQRLKELEEQAEQARRKAVDLVHDEEEEIRRIQAERADLEKMSQVLRREEREAVREGEIGSMQGRMDDFRGSDNASLHQRLRAEGWNELLIADVMKRRTLDAQLEREGGLSARMSHWSSAGKPLEGALESGKDMYKGASADTNQLYRNEEGPNRYMRSDDPKESYSGENKGPDRFGDRFDDRFDSIKEGFEPGKIRYERRH